MKKFKELFLVAQLCWETQCFLTLGDSSTMLMGGSLLRNGDLAI